MANPNDSSSLYERLYGRREFLMTAGGLVLSATPLALIGCGGVGGFGAGGANAPMVATNGTIGLPAGFGIPTAQLSVFAGLKHAAIKAPNGFTVKIAGQSPSLASLQDSAGNAIMLGFLDPAKSNNTLDHHSTAVALVYFFLGGYSLPSANTANVLNLISGDPSVSALAQVIATRIAADPHALSNGDAQIASALATCYNTVIPSGQPALRPNAISNATRELPGATRGNPTAQLLVQPTSEVGGMEVLLTTGALDILVTNHYRRRCKVFVYKTGTQPSGGTLTMFPKVQSFAGPIDVPSVEAIGLVNSLIDLFKGTSPLNPVSIPPITLELDSGATKTLYEVVVLSAAANNVDPAVYVDGRYVDQVSTFRSTRTALNIESILIDIVFGIFLELLGMRQIIASTNAVQAAADAIGTVEDSAWQAVIAEAQAGKYGQATIDALGQLATNLTVRRKVITALAPLLSAAQAAALQAVQDAELAAGYIAAKQAILKVLGAAGILLGFGDIGAVFYSLDNADPADVWTATAFVPAFALSPGTSTISAGSRVTLMITAPIGVAGNIEYDWTQTSSTATLSSSTGTVGNSIKTTSAATTVDLVTTPSDQGTITVTVIAYQVAAGGGKTEIGQVIAKVTISTVSAGATGTVIVEKYDPVNGNGYFTVYAFATFNAVPGAKYYRLAAGGTGGGALFDASDIPRGAPVVDVGKNNDLSTLVPYKDAFGNFSPFFNMGNGVIGFSTIPNSGFNRISQEAVILASYVAAMASFDYQVIVT